MRDPKKFGLEKPVATIRFGTGSSQASVVIGRPAEEGTVYARDLSRPAVFTVESSVLDDLKKDPLDYRQKDLFDAQIVQRDARRAGSRGTDQRLREDQGQEQGRAGRGEVAADLAAGARPRSGVVRHAALGIDRRPRQRLGQRTRGGKGAGGARVHGHREVRRGQGRAGDLRARPAPTRSRRGPASPAPRRSTPPPWTRSSRRSRSSNNSCPRSRAPCC